MSARLKMNGESAIIHLDFLSSVKRLANPTLAECFERGHRKRGATSAAERDRGLAVLQFDMLLLLYVDS